MRLHTVQMYRGIVVVIITLSHAIDVLHHRGFVALDIFKTRTGGVDFFFTLSGFIIYFVYSKYVGNELVIKSFLWRRFLRIYPLVWFFTLVSLPVFFLTSGIGTGNELHIPYILKSIFLLPQAPDPILGATWSLSHVVFFYIVFRFYLSHPKIVTAVIKVWVIAFFTNLILKNSVHSLDLSSVLKEFLLSPFNFEFLLGAMLANQALKKRFHYGGASVLSGCLLFVFGWFGLEAMSPPPVVAAIFCVASLTLIYGGVAIDRKYEIELPRICNIVGNSSYAIIIVNLPVIVAFSRFDKVIFDNLGNSVFISWGTVLVSVTLAIVGGVFTYKFVETTLLKLIDIVSKKTIGVVATYRQT